MADCLQLTGRAVVDASSREPAVSVCREAAVSAGESTVRASAYSSLAYSLLSLGRREEALAAAREAVRADGSSGNAHFIEAAALDELGRYGEAVGPHEEAIRLSPTSAGYRIRYAATLAKLDRWADALREGQEAQRMGSDDPYVKAAIETTMHEIEQGAHHRKWQRVIQDGRVIWRAP